MENERREGFNPLSDVALADPLALLVIMKGDFLTRPNPSVPRTDDHQCRDCVLCHRTLSYRFDLLGLRQERGNIVQHPLVDLDFI